MNQKIYSERLPSLTQLEHVPETIEGWKELIAKREGVVTKSQSATTRLFTVNVEAGVASYWVDSECTS